MHIRETHIFIGLLCILLIIGFIFYYQRMYEIRDESECKDIVEIQTELVAQMISQTPFTHIFKSVKNLRYMPDNSGWFYVLDFSGNLYCHGETGIEGKYNMKSPKCNLPFSIPVDNIIHVGRKGGGYVRYNWKGGQKSTYVVPVPHTPFIVCSGIMTDKNSVERRKKWKRIYKSFTKKGKPVMKLKQ